MNWPRWWDDELYWFQREGRTRHGWRWTVDASRSNLNLPRLHGTFPGPDDEVLLWVDWSNGNSDPVVSASIEIPRPP